MHIKQVSKTRREVLARVKLQLNKSVETDKKECKSIGRNGLEIDNVRHVVIIPSLTVERIKNSRNPSIFKGCSCFFVRNDMCYFLCVVLFFVFFIIFRMDAFVINS